MKLAALISSVTLARKVLVDDRTGHRLEQATTCNEKCLFENSDNSWCFTVSSPTIQTGWTYLQEFDNEDVDGSSTATINYFRFSLLPYISGYALLDSILNIERLYYNDF